MAVKVYTVCDEYELPLKIMPFDMPRRHSSKDSAVAHRTVSVFVKDMIRCFQYFIKNHIFPLQV